MSLNKSYNHVTFFNETEYFTDCRDKNVTSLIKAIQNRLQNSSFLSSCLKNDQTIDLFLFKKMSYIIFHGTSPGEYRLYRVATQIWMPSTTIFV